MDNKNLDEIFKLRAAFRSKEDNEAFGSAAMKNDIPALETLLQQWPTATTDWRGSTDKPIIAETYKYLTPETLKFLIDNGADINKPNDSGNWAPILGCAFLHDANTLEKLIRHGADIHARDSFGTTALHYAIDGKKYDCLDLLVLCGADLDAKNNAGETPRSLLEKNPMAAKVVFAAQQRLKQLGETQSAKPPQEKITAMKPIVLKDSNGKFNL